MPPTPILFLTDSPDLTTGLARIGRDLAFHIHTHLPDHFRVGFLGRGGMGGDFPFPVYTIPHNFIGTGGSAEWGASVLQDVWVKFTGSKTSPGIVFTIWDAARMLWLSRPEYIVESGTAKEFLTSRPFKLWGYFPIDGHTPSKGLGTMAQESLKGYDRVLAYTKYGAEILDGLRAVTGRSCEWLPHGMSSVWYPRGKNLAREQMGWREDDFCVGVVAANQLRKDWGLAARVGEFLRIKFGARYQQWWHTDSPDNPRGWSIDSLLDEFGLGPNTVLSAKQDDEWMAMAYSACDVTLGIGAGEGFGFPLVESQMCGTPVVHGEYAGGADFIPKDNLIAPVYGYRLEGPTNVMRPVYPANVWVESAVLASEKRTVADLGCLRWDNLWPKWEKWFRDGRESEAESEGERERQCSLGFPT